MWQPWLTCLSTQEPPSMFRLSSRLGSLIPPCLDWNSCPSRLWPCSLPSRSVTSLNMKLVLLASTSLSLMMVCPMVSRTPIAPAITCPPLSHKTQQSAFDFFSYTQSRGKWALYTQMSTWLPFQTCTELPLKWPWYILIFNVKFILYMLPATLPLQLMSMFHYFCRTSNGLSLFFF